MKKSKSERKEAWMDALLELVVAAVLFGLGALVLSAFGVGVDTVDGDVVLLIGVGAMALLGAVIWAVEILKKKKKPTDQQDEHDPRDDSGI